MSDVICQKFLHMTDVDKFQIFPHFTPFHYFIYQIIFGMPKGGRWYRNNLKMRERVICCHFPFSIRSICPLVAPSYPVMQLEDLFVCEDLRKVWLIIPLKMSGSLGSKSTTICVIMQRPRIKSVTLQCTEVSMSSVTLRCHSLVSLSWKFKKVALMILLAHHRYIKELLLEL